MPQQFRSMLGLSLVAVMGTLLCASIAAAQTRPAAPASRSAAVAGDAPMGDLLLHDDFTDLANWVSEGPHLVEIDQRRLRIKTSADERLVGQYVWLRRELPDDFRIEFDVTPASKSGFFLMFFCVRGVEGKDILGPELFEQYLNFNSWKPYHDWDKYTSPPDRRAHHASRIRAYHVSYRRNELANCNLRKNPGLELKKSSAIDAPLPAGRPAHVVLSKHGGHIALLVNDQLFMDWTDTDAPYSGGRFGLRQVYDSEGHYCDFKLFSLPPPAPAGALHPSDDP